MKDKIIQGVKFAIFLGLGVFLAWWVIKDLTEEQRAHVLNAMGNANYFWLGLSIAIGCIAQVSRTIRWQILIKPLGYHPRFWNTLMAVMISYGANMLFPRLGEVSRCAIVNKYEKVPVQHLLGTVITERILDLIALAAILFLGFLIEFEKISQYFNKELAAPLKVKLASMLPGGFGVVIGIVGVLVAVAAFWLLRRTILKLRFYHKVRNAALGLLDGVKSIKHVDKPFTLVFHSMFIWVCYYGMMHVCIYSMPETSSLSVGAVVTAFVAGALAMIITPGGIGAYPAFVMGALLLYDVNPAIGTAFGWLVWASQQVSIVAGSVISLILLPIVNRTSGNDETQPEVTPV
ncbi:lysylphosphatidylglycerol synthase transmembrane domain-containing protein [soil metagenome]